MDERAVTRRHEGAEGAPAYPKLVAALAQRQGYAVRPYHEDAPRWMQAVHRVEHHGQVVCLLIQAGGYTLVDTDWHWALARRPAALAGVVCEAQQVGCDAIAIDCADYSLYLDVTAPDPTAAEMARRIGLRTPQSDRAGAYLASTLAGMA